MENENTLVFSSADIELSEFSTYIELRSRLCWYGYPNANGVILPVDGAEEKAQTLVYQPVVAYYKKDYIGRDDLGGHEVTVDDKGEVHHGTESVGVNTSVEVAEDTVNINGQEVKTPCLFATRRIWTRNKKYVDAIKRLYKARKLSSSWEILVSSFHYADGLKVLDDYTFDADALLGSQVVPAYSCANTLSVAEADPDMMLLAEALADDINFEKEENTLEQTITNPKPETSALTEWDLRTKINAACQKKLKKRCYSVYHFPADRVVWTEVEDRESELDYVAFTYEVGADDEVTVSDPVPVKLTVTMAQINSAIAERDKTITEKDGVIAEKDTAIAAKDTELSQKDNALIKANERIQALEDEVATLAPYKAEHEEAERQRIEAENAAKRTALTDKLVKSKLFSEAEIQAEDIQTLINDMKESEIMTMIAERFMASLDKEPEASETSETAENHGKASLNDDPNEQGEFSITKLLEYRI